MAAIQATASATSARQCLHRKAQRILSSSRASLRTAAEPERDSALGTVRSRASQLSFHGYARCEIDHKTYLCALSFNAYVTQNAEHSNDVADVE